MEEHFRALRHRTTVCTAPIRDLDELELALTIDLRAAAQREAVQPLVVTQVAKHRLHGIKALPRLLAPLRGIKTLLHARHRPGLQRQPDRRPWRTDQRRFPSEALDFQLHRRPLGGCDRGDSQRVEKARGKLEDVVITNGRGRPPEERHWRRYCCSTMPSKRR